MKKFVSAMLTMAIIASMVSCAYAISITPNPGPASSIFGGTFGVVVGLVQVIGYALAIGMLIYLGIKYVTSSANEKADLKKGSVNYVIGAIIIASAATLVKLFFNFASCAITGN